MPSLIALSVSIGFLGAVATWLALGPLAGYILIWTIFVSWGCFFHSGADTEALKSTIIGNIFGLLCGLGGAALLLSVPIMDPLTAPIWVGVTVFVLVVGSKLAILSNIPAAVYGYASTFAYLLQTPDKLNMESLVPTAILLVASFVVGAGFGIGSAKLSGVLTKE